MTEWNNAVDPVGDINRLADKIRNSSVVADNSKDIEFVKKEIDKTAISARNALMVLGLSKTSRGVVTCKKYLSQKSELVNDRDKLEEIKSSLQSALHKQDNCVGLAAIQIGLPYRVSIYSIPGHGTGFLINPVIVKRAGSYQVDGGEGCMSFPGIRYKVNRAFTIDVETNGRVETFSGFAAAVIQHEIDHMDGKTVKDRSRHQKALSVAGKSKNRAKRKAAKKARKKNRRK